MLDVGTYEEVEADPSATWQAVGLVVCSSLAAAIGARGPSGAPATLAFFATASVVALVTWIAFAVLTFEIGGRILPTPDTRVDVDQLLRTLGFATAPGLVQALGVFSGAARPVFAVSIVWTIAASVIAVRQALDYRSTGRAAAVCGLAVLLSSMLVVVFGWMLSTTVSGI
jgi:hypothetical protein